VTSSSDKQTIVDAHNALRRRVAKGLESKGNPGPQPSAANMRKIVSIRAEFESWQGQTGSGAHTSLLYNR
jgi:hypothetical protein